MADLRRALKTAKRKPRPVTQKDLDALFLALSCRLDAIGEALSGSAYAQRALRNLELSQINQQERLSWYRKKLK